MKACCRDYYWLLFGFDWMWNYYSCAGKIMDCLMCFLFYALVLCLCLYDGDDTWIFHDVAKTFVDRTLAAIDLRMLKTDLHDK